LAYGLGAAATPPRRDPSLQAGPRLPPLSLHRQWQRRTEPAGANAVVNVDLPWNPAKLEQRIARAWRKNQTRSVTVVNLICEGSIEHQILHLLGRKQALADGLLDGQGDLGTLKMPSSGRAAMIERIEADAGARGG
jgi:hypothetical protein